MSLNWALMERQEIPAPDGTPYLSRLRIVATPLFCLYLHRIHASDGDRDLHSHPWSFVSMILRGGYIEVLASADDPKRGWVRARTRWSVHRHPFKLIHRIEIVAPGTVTLVLTGRRRDNWGFYTDNGFVPWQEYTR